MLGFSPGPLIQAPASLRPMSWSSAPPGKWASALVRIRSPLASRVLWTKRQAYSARSAAQRQTPTITLKIATKSGKSSKISTAAYSVPAGAFDGERPCGDGFRVNGVSDATEGDTIDR